MAPFPLSSHFNKEEFACNDGCGEDFNVPPELINILEAAREHFNQPIHINSGFRCVIYNKQVGGAPNSFHLQAWAADIVINNVSPKNVYDYFDQAYSGKYGFIEYANFVHIDVRPTKYHVPLN